MDTQRWEVSIVNDEHARHVIATDLVLTSVFDAMRAAQARIDAGDYPGSAVRTAAVLVQRMDQTAEAKRAQWEADFYDFDRRGYKRRRFRRPDIEKAWEAMLKAERKAVRDAAKQSNDTYVQRARG